MFSWVLGVMALFMASFGVAVAVDPHNFAPRITDPKALARRRIVEPIRLFLVAVLVGIVAFASYPVDLLAWLAVLVGCTASWFVLGAIAWWLSVVGRRSGRRSPDRPEATPR
jgi:hypothetical protein